ncbi:MAG: GtrA family protein [Ruminococcus sp.]|nr:GtrA family protein [Ruminococcus sp.]
MVTLNSLFLDKTSNFYTQLFRYIVVGGISFLVDLGLLYALTEWFYFHYLLSATLSFVTGLIVNYTLSTKWVFPLSSIQNKSIEFLAFSLIGVAGLGLNNLLLWCFTSWICLYYMYSKIITTFIVFIWNFMARKFLIFTPRSHNVNAGVQPN